MSRNVSLTVRSLPGDVHRELVARAARRGQSLQEYVRAELVRLVSRPSQAELVERVRARKALTGTRLSPEQIVADRDAERP